MRKLKVIILTLCAGIVIAACNNTGKGAAIGGAGGAVLGAVIGKLAGNAAVGAAVGTAVGAGTGALIGRHMDKVKAQAAAVQNAQVESVTDANGLEAVQLTFGDGVLFATGKSALSAKANASLEQIANVLKQNTDVDAAVFGHTDSTGSDAVNNKLSQERAKAVEAKLKSLGVNNVKVVEGKGSKEPVADNSTADGRAKNRRVEVIMYASQAMIQAAEQGTLK